MNKQALGVFRITRNRSLALSFWIASQFCFLALHYCDLHAQGVREREKAAATLDGSSPVKRSGGSRGKAFRFRVTTEPPAQCQFAVSSTTERNESNRAMPPTQVKFLKSTWPSLRPGGYTLIADCRGYEPSMKIVNIPIDISSRLVSLPLTPLHVQVVLITMPPEAEVALDRQPLGRSGVDGSIKLPPLRIGRYQLSVKKDGYFERLTDIDIQKDSKTISIDLRRDELQDRFASLAAALAASRLLESLNLYEGLARDGFDPARLRSVRVRLLEALNRRSLERLEGIGPRGLSLNSAELSRLRTLYQRARSVLNAEAPEDDHSFNVFDAFWEVKSLADTGAIAGADRQLTELRSRMERLETLRPDNARLWFDLGNIYQNFLNFERAELAFERARTLKPDWAYPYFGLATLHMNQAYAIKNSKKAYRSTLLRAAVEFETAAARDKQFVQANVMASFCYTDAAEGQKGINLARLALGISPRSGAVKFALGYAYFAAGRKQYAAARVLLSEAIAATEDPLDEAQAIRAHQILREIEGKRR
jgi:tetratricopeptide (TPR) repeat protein